MRTLAMVLLVASCAANPPAPRELPPAPFIDRALLVDRHFATYDPGEVGEVQFFQADPEYRVSFTWGGASEGLVFRSNGELFQHYNAGCSEESGHAPYFHERWSLRGRVITIRGPSRRVRYRIEAFNRTQLALRVLEHRLLSPQGSTSGF